MSRATRRCRSSPSDRKLLFPHHAFLPSPPEFIPSRLYAWRPIRCSSPRDSVATEEPSPPPSPAPRKRPDPISRQFGVALELPFVLVLSIVIGGFFGFLLDRWLHTKPILTLKIGRAHV